MFVSTVVLFLQCGLTLKRQRRKCGFHFLNFGGTSLRSPYDRKPSINVPSGGSSQPNRDSFMTTTWPDAIWGLTVAKEMLHVRIF